MLQDFRNNLKGTALFIVILISIPFALVGIDQIFISGNSVEGEVTVNGDKITKLEVERALEMHKQALRDRFDNLDPSMLDDDLLREPVRLRLIKEKVIAQRAQDEGMGIAKNSIVEFINGIEAFQVGGSFDRDTFEYNIQRMGYTLRGFYDSLTSSLLVTQTNAGITATEFVSNTDLADAVSLIEQERDYYYLTVPLADAQKKVDIDPSAVTDHYDKHRDRYTTEEQIAVDYIELSLDALAEGIIVEEDDLRLAYEEQKASAEADSTYQLAHILFARDDPIENEQRLEQVQTKLSQGVAFAQLARDYSDDLGSAEQGGELGVLTRDALPEPFIEALNTMQEGEISGPIKTDSGTHLLYLTKIDTTSFDDYSSAKPAIEQQLRRALAETLLPEKIELLREDSYNAESLYKVAENLGLQAATSAPFPRTGGEGIAAHPVVVKAAYSSDVYGEGYASDVLELSPTRAVVIKRNAIYPAKPRSLDEVSEEILSELKIEAARAIVKAKGEDVTRRLSEGESIEAIAKAEGLEWQVSIDTRRFGGDVDPEIRDQAFTIPARASLPHAIGFFSRHGDYVALSLTKIANGDAANLAGEQKAKLKAAVQRTLANQAFTGYEESLVAAADIESD